MWAAAVVSPWGGIGKSERWYSVVLWTAQNLSYAQFGRTGSDRIGSGRAGSWFKRGNVDMEEYLCLGWGWKDKARGLHPPRGVEGNE